LAGFGASQLGTAAPNANYIGWQGSGEAAETSAELVFDDRSEAGRVIFDLTRTLSFLFTRPACCLSGGHFMRFEMKRKDKSVNLRLPQQLLEAVRRRARDAGIPYQRFIRMALERAVQRPK
jgi:CopG antitoxin of type II toxin-antitoxin system